MMNVLISVLSGNRQESMMITLPIRMTEFEDKTGFNFYRCTVEVISIDCQYEVPFIRDFFHLNRLAEAMTELSHDLLLNFRELLEFFGDLEVLCMLANRFVYVPEATDEFSLGEYVLKRKERNRSDNRVYAFYYQQGKTFMDKNPGFFTSKGYYYIGK